jgi:type VI secretion system secreted protein Hcp
MDSKVRLMDRGHSADTMFLTIKGSSQGLISEDATTPESIGNFYESGHEDEILVSKFYYGASNPTHKGSGCPLGQSSSHPFILNKRMDKSSPLLLNAYSNGETLSYIELKCYRTSYFGRPEHFYTIILEDALISNIKLRNEQEIIVFTYKNIKIEHVLASTICNTAWKYSRPTMDNIYGRNDIVRKMSFTDKKGYIHVKGLLPAPDGKYLLYGMFGLAAAPFVAAGGAAVMAMSVETIFFWATVTEIINGGISPSPPSSPLEETGFMMKKYFVDPLF